MVICQCLLPHKHQMTYSSRSADTLERVFGQMAKVNTYWTGMPKKDAKILKNLFLKCRSAVQGTLDEALITDEIHTLTEYSLQSPAGKTFNISWHHTLSSKILPSLLKSIFTSQKNYYMKILFLSVLFHTRCSVSSLQKGSSAVRLKAPSKTNIYGISVQFILIPLFSELT